MVNVENLKDTFIKVLLIQPINVSYRMDTEALFPYLPDKYYQASKIRRHLVEVTLNPLLYWGKTSPICYQTTQALNQQVKSVIVITDGLDTCAKEVFNDIVVRGKRIGDVLHTNPQLCQFSDKDTGSTDNVVTYFNMMDQLFGYGVVFPAIIMIDDDLSIKKTKKSTVKTASKGTGIYRHLRHLEDIQDIVNDVCRHSIPKEARPSDANAVPVHIMRSQNVTAKAACSRAFSFENLTRVPSKKSKRLIDHIIAQREHTYSKIAGSGFY
jgi:hypothetical protein